LSDATVQAIWRYPIKSMLGERLPHAEVTARGLAGDRAYALVEKSTNRAAVVRTWAARLLTCRAESIDGSAVRVTCPDGSVHTTAQPDFEAYFSALFDRPLVLMSAAPSGLLVEFPAGTLGGNLSSLTEAPLSQAATPGTFFDYASIHLIATCTLEHLRRLYPQGANDVRRFRPNFVVETSGEPFVENTWCGRTLAIGDQVRLRATIPCPRCVNTTLPNAELPHDPGILRTLARHNRRDLGALGNLPCAGVYADVLQTGPVRPGDPIRFLD
jgi:uncharacterized protein YcbX